MSSSGKVVADRAGQVVDQLASPCTEEQDREGDPGERHRHCGPEDGAKRSFQCPGRPERTFGDRQNQESNDQGEEKPEIALAELRNRETNGDGGDKERKASVTLRCQGHLPQSQAFDQIPAGQKHQQQQKRFPGDPGAEIDGVQRQQHHERLE